MSFTGSQAGIVTDTAHTKAKIVEIRADRLCQAIAADHIVLVAGFQGVSTERDVTTLGRGGSDTTAAADLGAGLRVCRTPVILTAGRGTGSDSRSRAR